MHRFVNFPALALALTSTACGSFGHDTIGGESHDLTADGGGDADGSIDPGPIQGDATFEATSSETFDSSTVDATDAEVATDAASDADTESEVRPDAPHRCGDGWRDPELGEECDDGEPAGSSKRRACTDACRAVELLALASVDGDAGSPRITRTLGNGRHPIAATASGIGIVMVSSATTPTVIFTSLSAKGVASDRVLDVSMGTTALHTSDPVLTALPGAYAVAFTDYTSDSDEDGVALRRVDPATGIVGPLLHANATTAFSQSNPDVTWTGTSLVVAWTDQSNAVTGADVKYRTFSANLTPTSEELVLANTAATEDDVGLTPFAGGFAAAWKSSSEGLETLQVRAGTAEWSIGPYLGGPSKTRPALTALDDRRLLVAFGAQREGETTYEIRIAVLDALAPGHVDSSALVPTSGLGALDCRDVDLVTIGDRVVLSWRSIGKEGDPDADQIWLKEIAWSAVDGSVDLTHSEVAWPREAEHRIGDQRRPALCSYGLGGEPVLVSAWDDFGVSFDGEADGDVVLRFVDLPLESAGATP